METLVSGHLTAAAGEAAKLSDGMLRFLQLRHKRQSKERFGTFLTTSIDEGGGKVHKWLKGEQQPDVMYSTLFAVSTTDASQLLKEKMAEWTRIWKCDAAAARAKACTVIRKAIADAVLAGDYDEASGDLWSGKQRSKSAGSFRRNTAIGGDNWPLHEYAKVDKAEAPVRGAHAVPHEHHEHDPEEEG